MSKQRVVVICPGRGTYNKEELGYFHRFHHDKRHMLDTIDSYRATQHQIAISELDQAPQYNLRQHTAGENASALIYACARGDFAAIDRDKYDVVAVTGNSMGWYIALAMANALNETNGIRLINTMGSMMAGGLVGGQVIYPVIDDAWHRDADKEAEVMRIVASLNALPDVEIYTSIKLGGYLVFGANAAGLKALEANLPTIDDRYPMKLYNHAAFHTPLLQQTSQQAFESLPEALFSAPEIPMIDGRGHIWQPYSTDTTELHRYTLGHQVYDYYDFTKAIEVSVKEFCPDKLVILGPGATLGGAVAQSLIGIGWNGIDSKAAFIERQASDPFILAMGMEAQRTLAV